VVRFNVALGDSQMFKEIFEVRGVGEKFKSSGRMIYKLRGGYTSD
jgi:hypothetical protein